MRLLMKVKLFILSGFLVTLYACNNDTKGKINNNKIEEVEVDIQAETINEFFTAIQIWDTNNEKSIEKLGQKITQLDTTLQFFPLQNSYEKGSFIFSTKKELNFNLLIENSFIHDSNPIQSNTYKVWRRKVNGKNILDISIEPHPTLSYIFVIRKRVQE